MNAESMRGRFVEVVTELLDAEPRLAIVLAEITADQFASSRAGERPPPPVPHVCLPETTPGHVPPRVGPQLGAAA